MTKTTEELKREMYDQFSRTVKAVQANLGERFKLSKLENSLEAYLEALRQERSTIREERDELRNRLQAFSFANQSAGEFLQQARAKIKAQRQSIGQLKNERDNAEANEARLRKVLSDARKELSELRKSAGGTSGQSSVENSAESILGGVQRICQHSFRVYHAYPSGKLKSQCIFCLKIED